MRSLSVMCVLVGLVTMSTTSSSSAADRPKVLFSLPIAVVRGEATKLTLRGLQLDQVHRVSAMNLEPAPMLIPKASKVGVPNGFDAKKVGDTQVEIELTVPATPPRERVELKVETANGESALLSVPVIDRTTLVEDKEPNDGFRQAQKLELGQTVRGAFHQQRDVDVFQLTVKAGQKVVLDVQASRLGAPTDPELHVYRADVRLVAMKDDVEGRDPVLKLQAAQDEQWLIVLSESNDNGSNLHNYLLTVFPDR